MQKKIAKLQKHLKKLNGNLTVKIFKVLRTEVRGDFNIHGTNYF